MKRKYRLIFILFLIAFVVFSCSSLRTNNQIENRTNSLFGEWKTTCGDNINDIRLIILENGEYYKFSRFVGGKLLEKGLVLNSDSIAYGNRNRHRAYYNQEDSRLHLKEPCIYSLCDYVYTEFKKIDSENYQKTLKEYLIQDSLRNLLIGWWKVDTSLSRYDSIQQVFYPGKALFTLNIEDDGTATIFVNNKFDNNSKYTYRMTSNGILLSEIGGCMVSNHSIINVDSSSLVLTWNRNDDSLYFKRLIEIK